MAKQSKVKKQHYVPRFYLERWTIQGTLQTFVYDKKLKTKRKNSIKDIASENYFYSLKVSDLIDENIFKYIQPLPQEKVDEDDQFLEHFLSESVEGEFAAILNKMVHRVSSMNKWEADNCMFISERDKYKLAILIVMQVLRGKSNRRAIENIEEFTRVLVKEWNLPEDFLQENTFRSKNDLKRAHCGMLLDFDSIERITNLFYLKTWMLYKNETSKLFYTSDNPIFTHATKNSPWMSYDGFCSEGVEVLFPISPRLMLVMISGDDFPYYKKYDKRIVIIRDVKAIERCNECCAIKSERCVVISDGDYTTIDRIMEKAPQAFDIPKMEMKLGNKSFYSKD